MSYDLNVWSRQRIEADQKEFHIDKYVVTVEESVTVENEDIPVDVMLSLSEIKYLTSLHLQPYTNEKTIIDRATRYAKKLAKEYRGVVEDPQGENGVVFIDQRKTFGRVTQDAEKVSISWYMDCRQSLADQIADFVDLLEKYLPQALPRRYGSFEPPQFRYSEMGKDHLIQFLQEEHTPVLYCTKPIIYIFLSDAFVDNQRLAIDDYRCNKIEIEMLKEAYLEPNWQFAVKQLFQEVAKVYKPFYAEIVDEKESTVCSWWWKGIPTRRGETIIIGEPYSTLLGELPRENEIASGLYFFEQGSDQVEIPSKYVSKKKLLSGTVRSAGFFADSFRYATVFPFNRE